MQPAYSIKAIALATKHSKEEAIAPPFQKHLGAAIVTPVIDTDMLGTFSGEVERKLDALETAIQKARLGMQYTKLPYGLANEGSFGGHPFIPFLPCDTELLVYIDDERGFTLHEIILSEKTNYNHACITTQEELYDFLKRADFPSHGVIIRPHVWNDKNIIFKGIQDQSACKKALHVCIQSSADSKAWIETDMRANYNPTRMEIIGTLAEKLAKRLATLCPSCKTAGWGRVRVEKGLPCEYCAQPTENIAHEIYGCVLCDYTETLPRSDGITTAKQMHCGWCNP